MAARSARLDQSGDSILVQQKVRTSGIVREQLGPGLESAEMSGNMRQPHYPVALLTFLALQIPDSWVLTWLRLIGKEDRAGLLRQKSTSTDLRPDLQAEKGRVWFPVWCIKVC